MAPDFFGPKVASSNSQRRFYFSAAELFAVRPAWGAFFKCFVRNFSLWKVYFIGLPLGARILNTHYLFEVVRFGFGTKKVVEVFVCNFINAVKVMINVFRVNRFLIVACSASALIIRESFMNAHTDTYFCERYVLGWSDSFKDERATGLIFLNVSVLKARQSRLYALTSPWPVFSQQGCFAWLGPAGRSGDNL